MIAAKQLPVPGDALESASSQPLIEVEGVSKKFARRLRRSLFYAVRDLGTELTGRSVRPELRRDEFWALQDVSFSLRRGESLGIIGPNGAGKSTLLKIITGIIKPTTGFVRTRGRVQALIELSSGMSPILTGRENIYIRGSLFGIPKAVIDERFDAIVHFAELEDYIDMPLQNYSSGMRVKLGFAIAINVDPDVLIIDEVLAVGDQRFRAKAREAMQELLERNIALIYISHNMNQVISITDRAVWIEQGVLREIGEARDVCARYLLSQRSSSSTPHGVVEMPRSVGMLSLTGLEHSKPQDPLANRVKVCGGRDERNLSIQVTFKVNETLPERVYFTWFLTENNIDFAMYKMIQDVCRAGPGEVLQRTFTFDLSVLNPGVYQLGLSVQPEEGVTTVFYGTRQMLEIEVAAYPAGKGAWQSGAPHYHRMIGSAFGSGILPVDLVG